MIFEEKANLIISNYIRSKYPIIDVIPGLCRFNYKCHINSVNDAINNNDNSIALVIMMHKNNVSIHFINYTNGKYIDNTLGQWSSKYQFYFVKSIFKEDFFNIEDIFTNYRITLNNILPFWLRYFIPLNTF